MQTRPKPTMSSTEQDVPNSSPKDGSHKVKNEFEELFNSLTVSCDKDDKATSAVRQEILVHFSQTILSEYFKIMSIAKSKPNNSNPNNNSNLGENLNNSDKTGTSEDKRDIIKQETSDTNSDDFEDQRVKKNETKENEANISLVEESYTEEIVSGFQNITLQETPQRNLKDSGDQRVKKDESKENEENFSLLEESHTEEIVNGFQNITLQETTQRNSKNSGDQRDKQDESNEDEVNISLAEVSYIEETENDDLNITLQETPKFDRAKTLKDTLSSILHDKQEASLQDSDDSKNVQCYWISFFLWTFALRPGSNDSYEGKGPLTLQQEHLTLDSENRTVTLRFPTKGKVRKGSDDPGTKMLSISLTAPQKLFKLFEEVIAKPNNAHVFDIGYNNFLNYLKQNHGLLPKDFRTAAASYAFQTLLDNTKSIKGDKVTHLKKCAEKVQKYLQHTTVGETIRDYLDPRIIVAWCRKHKIEVDNLPKSMKPKIVDELNVPEEFQF